MVLINNFILVILCLQITAYSENDDGFCSAPSECTENEERSEKLLFYDVNPPEGFNLRRDVYMRFAIMISEAVKTGKKGFWRLVLSPWHRMYHWRSTSYKSKPLPWQRFFDLASLKSYAPVAELDEILSETPSKQLEIDTVYVLQNFDDPFEGGTFLDKWEISNDEDCEYDGNFWGYSNVRAKEVVCVRFQGKISKLWELVSLHRDDEKVMFAHGEIPLHETYGTKQYWDCRKSMVFNKDLLNVASKYVNDNFNCKSNKCSSYISVHWRRQDFVSGRKDLIPSIKGAVTQINNAAKKLKINKIFIASDASPAEIKKLENGLTELENKVYFFKPNKSVLDEYKDGGIAIIDQIICSRSAFFIGTHESTFTFRIQEEREIIGHESDTTFNRLCPDVGQCESPSRWTIVS